jgi:hypothetical protein
MRTNAAIVSTIGTAKKMMEKKSDNRTLVEVTKKYNIRMVHYPGGQHMGRGDPLS